MKNFKIFMKIVKKEMPAGFGLMAFIIALLVGFKFPTVGNIMMLLITIYWASEVFIILHNWVITVVDEYKKQIKGEN